MICLYSRKFSENVCPSCVYKKNANISLTFAFCLFYFSICRPALFLKKKRQRNEQCQLCSLRRKEWKPKRVLDSLHIHFCWLFIETFGFTLCSFMYCIYIHFFGCIFNHMHSKQLYILGFMNMRAFNNL